MRIRVTTRANLYEKRKQEHIERGYRVEDERPIPVNGFCSFVAVRDVPHNWISDLENGKSNRDYYRGFTVSASSTIVTSTKSWLRSASTSLT